MVDLALIILIPTSASVRMAFTEPIVNIPFPARLALLRPTKRPVKAQLVSHAHVRKFLVLHQVTKHLCKLPLANPANAKKSLVLHQVTKVLCKLPLANPAKKSLVLHQVTKFQVRVLLASPAKKSLVRLVNHAIVQHQAAAILPVPPASLALKVPPRRPLLGVVIKTLAMKMPHV